MTKKEFLIIVEKYEQNRCTEQEVKLLHEYCAKVQYIDLKQSFDLSESEKIRVSLLAQLNESIALSLKSRKRIKKTNYPKWIAAACLIGSMVLGYFYTQKASDARLVSTFESKIILELEDGSIKKIEKNSAVKLLNKNGKIIGQQYGNTLTYTKADNSGELVYNRLTVPYGENFELVLSDGTKVSLNAGSSLKYPVRFLEGKKRKVFITGEAYLNVAKDTTSLFVVSADNLNIGVFGTQFNVHSYPEDNVSEVVLVEGSVGLYRDDEQLKDGKSTLLEPGFKAVFDKRSKRITKEKVLTNFYTSWRSGELIFRDMPFDMILKKLERHYNITITNNNKGLSGKVFNASFGKLPFETVFENLEKYYQIQSTITGDTVIINNN